MKPALDDLPEWIRPLIKLLIQLAPPCPTCNYYVKFCRCPTPSHWMAL